MARYRAPIPPLLGAVLLLAAACGGGPTDPTIPPAGDPIFVIEPGVADGPGISIDDAIAGDAAEPVLVNGSLFVDPDGTVRLCSAILESFPPQCGGSRLEVRGLDLGTVAGLQEANGIRWVDSIQLLGRVQRA